MRTLSNRCGLCILSLVVVGSWVAGACADEPAKTDKPADQTPSAKTDKPGENLSPIKPESSVGNRPLEKPGAAISFEMREKPWASVLEWLTDQTGMPFVGDLRPTGSFTFIGPRGKSYTLPEIIDILNESLLTQKRLLIRRDKLFTIVPADEKIDKILVPRIGVDDLKNRGNTEVVSVVIQLNTLVAEDIAPVYQKGLMGPFGEATAIPPANQLVLQDTASNVKRIYEHIKRIEEREAKVDSFTHACKYIKAREAERILKELLGDAVKELLPSAIQHLAPQGGRGGPQGQIQPSQVAAAISAARSRLHRISANEEMNTVFVTGPADKIAQARSILKSLDVKHPGTDEFIPGPPSMQTYPVLPGTADAVAKSLQEEYKTSNTVRISTAGTAMVLVWARADDQFKIAKIIHGLTAKTRTQPEMIRLTTTEPSEMAETLKGMLGDPKGGAAPFIKADSTQNAIIVNGTAEQIAQVRAIVQAIEGAGGVAGGNVRIINVGNGSGAAVAEELQRLLWSTRQIPSQIITPGEPPKQTDSVPSQTIPSKGQGSEVPRSPAGGSEEQDDPTSKQNPPPTGAGAGPLVDPQAQKKESQPAGKPAPLQIIAVGNQIIISGGDPQTVALAQQIVNLLKSSTGQGTFQVIKLKNANAPEAARILDEAFNGVRQQPGQQGQGGFPMGGGFGGPGGRAPGAPQAPAPAVVAVGAGRIRVVADPATNSLLVRATPLDMLEVRRLLSMIDVDDKDNRAVIRTHVIGPLRHANATEIATVIRDVYREQMNVNAISTQVGGFPGFGFFTSRFRGQGVNLDASGNPRTVALSIGVDDRSNSLVLACSQAMYDDIKVLVNELELRAKDSTRTVEVVKLEGIDPVMVQRALEAVQGRQRGRPATSGVTGMPATGFFPAGVGGMIVPGGGIPFGPRFGGDGAFDPSRGGSRGDGGSRDGGRRGDGGSRGGGSRGSGGRISHSGERGPDFFAHWVKDDPKSALLYDPQLVTVADSFGEEQEQQPQPPPAGDKPATEGPIRGPRSSVNAEALPELGVIVISGNNPADVEEVKRIISLLRQLTPGAELQIEIMPLDRADATSVANTLTRVFQYVILSPTGNLPAPARGAATAAPAPAPTTTPTPGAAPTPVTTAQAGASVLLIPLPRLNSILFVAPKARVEDVRKQISRLDVNTSLQGQVTPFPLKYASARVVAGLLTSFYAQRYGQEPMPQHQIRITYDDGTNTVYVQAAPADLREITELIQRIDSTASKAENTLRIVTLKNALADDLANILVQALSQGLVPPTPGAVPGIFPGAPTTAPGITPGAITPGAFPPGQIAPGQVGIGQPGRPGAGNTLRTKSTVVRFVSDRKTIGDVRLEDISITSDIRTNSLIISAPEKSMELVLALIHALDVVPAARAEIKVFPLKNADPVAIANMLQQLFLGTGAAGRPGAPGTPGAGALPGVGAPGTVSQLRPLTLTVEGKTPEGAPLIELRISVDQRTNSLIVGGSRNDLLVIEAIVKMLDDTPKQTRYTDVYHVRNSSAADLATALNSILTSDLQVQREDPQWTAYQDIIRQVIVVPEPTTNRLLINATAEGFAAIMQVIEKLDAEPPQVAISVLVAEVDLTGSEEFGIEIGLQSPILFQRSIVPATGFLGPNGSINYGEPFLPGGVTVNSTINPVANPGFNFNTINPLGNNPVVSPNVIGVQGLGNFGMGRANPNGIGGFVFSAASDSFNLLVRALKTQGRLEILSRPQITTLDNQTASILVGQYFPYITGSTVATGVTGIPTTVNNINYQPVGVSLLVTPRISPDGRVLLRVKPEVSSPAQTTVNLGNNVFATAFNTQTLETTISVMDGETVALGGLISRRDEKNENKIPWFGDLPGLGALFRYRTQNKLKTELLIILTPHIVRSREEADQVLAREAQRLDGMIGKAVILEKKVEMQPAMRGSCGAAGSTPGPVLVPNPGFPNQPQPNLGDSAVPGPAERTPPPAPQPAPQGQESRLYQTPAPREKPRSWIEQTSGPALMEEKPLNSSTPIENGKEAKRWNVFRRNP